MWRHWVCGRGGRVAGCDAACDRVSGLGHDTRDCVQMDRSGCNSRRCMWMGGGAGQIANRNTVRSGGVVGLQVATPRVLG